MSFQRTRKLYLANEVDIHNGVIPENQIHVRYVLWMFFLCVSIIIMMVSVWSIFFETYCNESFGCAPEQTPEHLNLDLTPSNTKVFTITDYDDLILNTLFMVIANLVGG